MSSMPTPTPPNPDDYDNPIRFLSDAVWFQITTGIEADQRMMTGAAVSVLMTCAQHIGRTEEDILEWFTGRTVQATFAVHHEGGLAIHFSRDDGSEIDMRIPKADR